MSLAWRVYRRLAQAFPHEFKVAYGTELMQAGRDALADVVKRQGVARADPPDRGHRDPRAC